MLPSLAPSTISPFGAFHEVSSLFLYFWTSQYFGLILSFHSKSSAPVAVVVSSKLPLKSIKLLLTVKISSGFVIKLFSIVDMLLYVNWFAFDITGDNTVKLFATNIAAKLLYNPLSNLFYSLVYPPYFETFI